MKQIKSLLAGGLAALIVLAGLGFGIVLVGFAIVLGGAFALALRLGASDIEARLDETARTRSEARADDDTMTAAGVAA